MNYRDTKKSFGIVAVCFLLVAVLLCGIMTSWFKDWNPYCWFGHEYDADGVCTKCGELKPVDEEDIEENNEQLAFAMHNGHNLFIRRIANKSDIENSEVGSTTITATVGGDATDKTVSWSIAWKDAESEWANGKSIADYLSLDVDDDTNTVTINCLHAFGEQAIVTCKANGAEDLTATATVDFMKRLIGVQVECEAINLNNGVDDNGQQSSDLEKTMFVASAVYGIGTVEYDKDVDVQLSSVKLTLSDALQAGIAGDIANLNELSANFVYNTSVTKELKALSSDAVAINFSDFLKSVGSTGLAYVNAARGRIYKNVNSEGWYIIADVEVKAVVNGTSNTYTVSLNVPISNEYMTDYTLPDTITLDKTEIIF